MSKPSFSVLHIQILLHYYARAEDWDCVTETHYKYREHLIREGLLQEQPNDPNKKYNITEKGSCHVLTICNLGLPVQRWISPVCEEPCQ